MRCPVCNSDNASSSAYCASCGVSLQGVNEPTNTLLSLPPGTQLLGGAYRIGKVLGQGGFGITYLGSDTNLQRRVAIKEFFPQGAVVRQGKTQISLSGSITAADYHGAKAKFIEEGQTLARFKHPGIVGVYAAFEENNTAYVVMEFLEGKTLNQLVRERGVLPESEAVDYIKKVGKALEVVHQANLLHRDIKPDNIILDAQDRGRIVLIDFGAARAFMAGKSQQMTQIYTFGYAPLEQRGSRAQFGAYTDIYALGATLYYLLTGKDPVDANDRVCGVELPSIQKLNSKVSEKVVQAVMGAMEIKAKQRPQSVSEFLNLFDDSENQEISLPKEIVTEETNQASELSLQSNWRCIHTINTKIFKANEFFSTFLSTIKTQLDLGCPWEIENQTASSIAISPDGQTLVIGQRGGAIRIWNLKTRKILRTLKGHYDDGYPTSWLESMIISPDGQIFISGSNDKTIKIWHLETGKLLQTLSVHSGGIHDLAISPDGQTLASSIGRTPANSNYDETIKIWNLETGKLLQTLSGHSKAVWSVAISPDGSTLVSSGDDKTIKIWNLETGKLLQTLSGHSKAVWSVAISPDGSTLVSGSHDKTIRIWNLETGKLLQTLSGHSKPVRSVAISPDGSTLVSSGDDKTIKIWNLETGKLLQTLSGHSESITLVVISPDGQTLVSASHDKTIRIWRCD